MVFFLSLFGNELSLFFSLQTTQYRRGEWSGCDRRYSFNRENTGPSEIQIKFIYNLAISQAKLLSIKMCKRPRVRVLFIVCIQHSQSSGSKLINSVMLAVGVGRCCPLKKIGKKVADNKIMFSATSHCTVALWEKGGGLKPLCMCMARLNSEAGSVIPTAQPPLSFHNCWNLLPDPGYVSWKQAWQMSPILLDWLYFAGQETWFVTGKGCTQCVASCVATQIWFC